MLRKALRAGSSGVGEGARIPDCEAACTSRPAVKARGPAPVRRMVRTAGSVERRVKMRERLSHILGEGGVGFSFGCVWLWWRGGGGG